MATNATFAGGYHLHPHLGRRRVPAVTVPVRKRPLRLPLLVVWWLVRLVVRLVLLVAGSPVAD